MSGIAAVVPGRLAPRHLLVDVGALLRLYHSPTGPLKKVEFGTSGHRGSSLDGGFTVTHIAVITQAICEYRKAQGITGPLFIGYDTHALSRPAFETALEVLAANRVEVVLQSERKVTATPIISHQILAFNRSGERQADGIIITPSHNGPQDGGFKYNPPHGGPADTDATGWIQNRANEIIAGRNGEVDRVSIEKALASSLTHQRDFIKPYVDQLIQVVDIDAIHDARLRLGVDALGGSSIPLWEPIADRYGLQMDVFNNQPDSQFSFMRLDSDGTIRMDCSSPDAMAGLVGLKDRYDIAFGNDTDSDRHGIVTPDGGLMNPNHYLAAAIHYLLTHRPMWGKDAAIGKTLVSSSMIDKVVEKLGRKMVEVPVGFKWFVQGLLNGSFGFGGEESAGACFLKRDGTTWVTEKDGIIMDLLAAEILAVTGKTPSQIYRDEFVPTHGNPIYRRVDGPITEAQKKCLKTLQPGQITATTLNGFAIVERLINAPGNGKPIGGVKVVFSDGSWFALRPSGTEPKMKLYIESWSGQKMWDAIHGSAANIVFAQEA